DFYFTVGESIGRSGCEVPTCGLHWMPTRQPVDLAEWKVRPCGRAFTTVGTWRGPYDPVEYRGGTYGLRVHEFRHLVGLVYTVDECLCVALDIDPADGADIAALAENGWQVVDPIVVAGQPEAYRSFVQDSMAEIAVAKGIYVQTRCGWFSDRSACYLAG